MQFSDFVQSCLKYGHEKLSHPKWRTTTVSFHLELHLSSCTGLSKDSKGYLEAEIKKSADSMQATVSSFKNYFYFLVVENKTWVWSQWHLATVLW